MAVAAIGFAPAAGADSSTGSTIAGYNVTALGIGAQFALNVPNLVPLPGDNLIEEDLPFARTIVGNGPTVDAIGAPYYPGDILANLGGLESEFFPPQLPNTPWPFMARAQYPTTTYGATSTFGGAPQAGSPVQASVLAGTANAASGGGGSTGSITDLIVGPGMGTGGANLMDVASIQSSDAVTIATSTISAVASSVVRAINVAGMVDISSITSNASSSSDGNTGTPGASLTVGSVTVDGQQAYIDDQGVHVAGNSTSLPGVPGVTDLQSTLDSTLAQDGITIRLLDPQKTVNGAEAIANSGGLVISVAHALNVPFVNTGALTANTVQPCIPTQSLIPGQAVLGDVCLPAGTYNPTTSITLGLASTDVNATAVTPFSTPSSVSLGGLGGLGGFGSDTSTGLGGTGVTTVGNPGGVGSIGSVGTRPLVGGLLKFPIRGVPAPLGWIILGAVLCIIFAWPMMLAARWQFLSGRR